MKKTRAHEIIFVVFILLAIAVWYAYFQYSSDKLKVYFFNVGQGDSEMLVAPGGQEVLIDGGPDSSVLTGIGKAMPFFDREIELVILTHPHADHVTGLVDVLKCYKVDEVWFTNVSYDSDPYKDFKNLIIDKNIPSEIPAVGQIKRFGQLKLTVLGPLENFDGKQVDNLNNTSIVTEANYGKINFLMTGDAEIEEQTSILNAGIDLKADVLKEPHHGSEKVTQDFLNKVKPDFTIISCGKNNQYGFPNPDTLNKLKNINTKVFRTDEDSTVVFLTDGNSISSTLDN